MGVIIISFAWHMFMNLMPSVFSVVYFKLFVHLLAALAVKVFLCVVFLS